MHHKVRIGLTGYAQSGKDTVGQMLGRYGFERIAFADPLRAGILGVDPWVNTGTTGASSARHEGYSRLSELVEKYGWDEAKVRFPEVRRLMQAYGTEGGREVHGTNCWTDIAVRKIYEHPRCVVTDVRFPNEVELIKGLGGQVWRIERPGTGPVNAHVSDDVGRLDVQQVIVNGAGLHELATSVDHLVSELL